MTAPQTMFTLACNSGVSGYLNIAKGKAESFVSKGTSQMGYYLLRRPLYYNKSTMVVTYTDDNGANIF